MKTSTKAVLFRRRQLSVVQSQFTQSLGTNRVVNGDFSNGLTGWVSTGSPTVFEVVGGRMHVVGTGAAGVQGAALFSPQLGAGLYEISYDVQVVSGSFTLQSPSNSGGFVASHTTGVSQTFYALWSPAPVNNRGTLIIGVSGTTEFYVDNHSVAFITPNPVWIMPAANGVHTLAFTLPGSPCAGQRIEKRYRQQDTANYWAAVIVRNSTNTAWDFQLNSVSAGIATNRISATSVGAVDAVRVNTNGTTHTAYTGSGGMFTQRGSPVSVSHLDTQRGVTAVYSSTFTPIMLSSG